MPYLHENTLDQSITPGENLNIVASSLELMRGDGFRRLNNEGADFAYQKGYYSSHPEVCSQIREFFESKGGKVSKAELADFLGITPRSRIANHIVDLTHALPIGESEDEKYYFLVDLVNEEDLEWS